LILVPKKEKFKISKRDLNIFNPNLYRAVSGFKESAPDMPNYQTLDSRYDEFLFAEVGEQANGMPMSMASAFARLGLDPWEEAARLAALPASAARVALAEMVAHMSDVALGAAESAKLVADLTPLLSRRGQVSTEAVPVPRAVWWRTVLQLDSRWLVTAIAVGSVISAGWLLFSR
jgi:hypothetical protein